MSDTSLAPTGERKPGRPARVLTEMERRRLSAIAAIGLSPTMAAARLAMAHRTMFALLDRDEDAAIAWGLGRAEAGQRLLEILWEQAESGSPQSAATLAKLIGFDLEGGNEPGGGQRGTSPVAISFNIVSADGSTVKPVGATDADFEVIDE